MNKIETLCKAKFHIPLEENRELASILLGYSTFSQAHKVDTICINAHFLFRYIWSFFHHLILTILINRCQLVKGLPFKIADFVSLFNLQWHSQNKIGNTGILVLWRDPEIFYCVR